jgi:hypothetical protein
MKLLITGLIKEVMLVKKFIEEQCIDRDTAYEINKKGFNLSCVGGWDKEGVELFHPDSDITIDAPLFQQVVDWFEIKGINIEIMKLENGFRYSVFRTHEENINNVCDYIREGKYFAESRKAALVSAIKIGLSFIK